MINPQWLELPISRTNIHGPKDDRAIEVRLYIFLYLYCINHLQGLCVGARQCKVSTIRTEKIKKSFRKRSS